MDKSRRYSSKSISDDSSSILYNSAIEEDTSILNDIYSSLNDEPESKIWKTVYLLFYNELFNFNFIILIIVLEPEDNKNTYIVYGADKNDELLLTASDISIKERDALTRIMCFNWFTKFICIFE